MPLKIRNVEGLIRLFGGAFFIIRNVFKLRFFNLFKSLLRAAVGWLLGSAALVLLLILLRKLLKSTIKKAGSPLLFLLRLGGHKQAADDLHQKIHHHQK